MILIDSSAWVEFERASDSATDRHLQHLMATGASIAVSEPILMEVLAGARNDSERRRLERVLKSFEWIETDVHSDFDSASRVYSLCRAAGFTPRGLIDCMIAAIAMRTRSTLLTADRDFIAISEIMPLMLEPTN